MIAIRKATDRGSFDHGWLQTHHTFSFGEYQDPRHNQFRALRVMNEDFIAPGEGFGMHGHRDMEIVTLVLEGQLAHRDSLGNTEVLSPGELQRMSAGTGIRHSEFNPSETVPVHLYQIWLFPEKEGLTPSYEQKKLDFGKNAWALGASRDGRDGALRIHQDAEIYLTRLEAGKQLAHSLTPGRSAWLQVLRGGVTLAGNDLSAGDGAAIRQTDSIQINASSDAELMMFDLA
jgi:redox-sensitive bicupin YhaK (pirin superfamily)